MERVHAQERRGIVRLLCKVLGKEESTWYGDVGKWTLDYASCYGGFVVEEILSEGGGVTHPLGDLRRSAREFCSHVNFTLRCVEAMDPAPLVDTIYRHK